MKHIKFALLMIAGTLAAGAASAAAVDNDAPSRVVRYTSESLNNDSGVRSLYRRIVAASRQVCPEDYGDRNLAAHVRVEACREQAVSRAIQHINNAQLAALHASNSKNS